MVDFKQERVAELARLVGITVHENEQKEVGDRLDCLLREMQTLEGLDLSDVQPITIFPEEPQDGA